MSNIMSTLAATAGCQMLSDLLRKTLLKDAVPITLLYSGLSVGTAEVWSSESFSNRIDYGMSDTIHAETCSIFSRIEEEMATMDPLFFLTIKCEQEEYEQGEEVEQANEFTTPSRSCANLGKVINPTDIMVVVGAPQPYPIPSLSELMPEEGDERFRLDLDHYRSNNQRIVEPPKEIGGVDASCQLKVLTKHCEAFIDVVIKQVSRLTSPMPDEQPLFTHGQRNIYKHKIVENTVPVPVRDMKMMSMNLRKIFLPMKSFNSTSKAVKKPKAEFLMRQ
ncbi:GH19687 [Drosophila grimshawi]|uniref:GH19687 n=1 Tax=Drosophila grimshawi TaxID=7222 RepID=B4K024_DROGR|nr:GH19687 [Drosophila grimshawi]